jgi:hypothetical protein
LELQNQYLLILHTVEIQIKLITIGYKGVEANKEGSGNIISMLPQIQNTLKTNI